MRVDRFARSTAGRLVAIGGTDPRFGEAYEHWAFVPHPLPETVSFTPGTWAVVAEAMHALGRLDQAGRQLPNPALLRWPTLRREAQSTSALEGTYATLAEVLQADLDEEPLTTELNEILNYVVCAEHAYAWVLDRRVTAGLLLDLHRLLLRGTPQDGKQTGRVRSIQVVIGPPGARVTDARFVPPPPGADLEAGVRDWVRWVNAEHRTLPAVACAALAHYQFETLHPFHDGNGRIGRLMIVVQLIQLGALREPLIAVSPWFEARRREYHEQLQQVSETGDYDPWVAFFSEGVRAQAEATAAKIEELLALQVRLADQVKAAKLRGVAQDIAHDLIGRPVVTPTWAARHYGVSYPAANTAIRRLADLGMLRETTGRRYARFFTCDDVVRVLER